MSSTCCTEIISLWLNKLCYKLWLYRLLSVIQSASDCGWWIGWGPDWRDLRLSVWLMNCYCMVGTFYCFLYGEERIHLWVGMLSPFTSPFPAMHQCTHTHKSTCLHRNTLINRTSFSLMDRYLSWLTPKGLVQSRLDNNERLLIWWPSEKRDLLVFYSVILF